MKRKTTFLAKAFLMLFAVLFSLTGARADELTVYDGTDNNSYIPFYGLYADTQGAASEFVIPSDDLVEMTGGTITEMKFYLKQSAAEAWTGTYQVYLNEVAETTLTGITGPDASTVVATASFDATGTELTVTFDDPYTYEGGNLLIGSYVSVAGNYKSAYFYGVTQTENTGWYRKNASAAGEGLKFIPKTTFTYTAGSFDGVRRPTGLKVNYDGGTEATVSWSSEESSFDINVNGTITEDVENPTTLTGLSYATTYNVMVRAKKGTEVSDWSNYVSFTTDISDDMCQIKLVLLDSWGDGWNGDAAIVIADVLSGIEIGRYTVTSAAGKDPVEVLVDVPNGREIQFTWKAGNYDSECSYTAYDVNGEEIFSGSGAMTAPVTYHVDCAVTPYRTPTNFAVSEITKNSAQLSWTENGTATEWVINVYDETNDDSFGEFTTSENPYTLTGLDPETQYTANVRPAGENTKWSEPVHFTTADAFAAPTDVAASNVAATSADVSWTGTGDSYNLRYRVAPLGGTLTTDFEDSSLGEWTTIDADGDGFCWDLTTNLGNFSHHNESADCVTSGSYDSNAGALNPDNYLVSPQVLLGGSITFWACAQDASYAAEHFGVAVSTTSNTDPSAFTTIQEWTMTSAGTPSSRRKVAGTWGEYTVDLSAYAGQTGYVAIRHFNCSDFFYLNIDDITIEQPVATEDPWTVVEGVTSPYTIESLTPETTYQVQVQAVYSDGVSSWTGTTFTTLEDVATPSALAVSDVTWGTAVLSWTENGEATAWEVCLNGDETNLISADSNPFTVEGLTPETEYTAKVRAVKGEKKSYWSNEVAFTTDIRFHAPTDVVASNVTTNSAEISWTATDAAATSFELQYAEGNVFGSLLRYDDGTVATNIGNSSSATWTWGVMYPGSMVNATQLAKVIIYEGGYNTEDITINIYQGGDSAPETLLYTETVTPVGGFHEVTLATPVAITPGKNLWITLTETGTYALVSCVTTEPNNQWVYNGSWANIGDLASTLAGYGWMIRAEINDGIDPATVTWTSVADVTSPYELTGLNPETTYTASVKAVYGTEGESKWTSTVFSTLSDNPVPSNIACDLAADGATLTWDGTGDSYNVQYRTASVAPTLFTDDFENGLDNWTIVTAGEGPGWVIGTETSTNAATAYSWNSSGSYAADNWLISPAIELGGSISFSAANNSSYADAYEVLLSTTGNATSDFTIELKAMSATATGNIDIDLSAYTGTGYIAFHHVSTDKYLLAIDNVVIYGAGSPAGTWQEMAVTGTTATISGLATNNAYEYQIQSVKGANTSAWSDLNDFALLTLANDADNTSLVNSFNGYLAHVTLADRTLYKDGKWNTLTVPFTLTPAELGCRHPHT